MFYTTLNCIHQCGPCCEGWEQLLKHLGKTKADDEPLPLLTILESNGLDDAVWALRAIDDCPEIRLFAVRCVRQVQYLLTDSRSLDALDIAEQYAIGEASKEELDAAAEEAVGAVEEAEVVVDVAEWAAAMVGWAEEAVAMVEWAIEMAGDWGGMAEMRETQRRDFLDIFCSPDL